MYRRVDDNIPVRIIVHNTAISFLGLCVSYAISDSVLDMAATRKNGKIREMMATHPSFVEDAPEIKRE